MLQEHVEAAIRWSGSSKHEHADHMIRTPPPLGDLVAEVERGLRRPARPFTLRVDEVPVAGQGWWPVAHGHVLVSSALLRDHQTLLAVLRPEIEQVA